MSLNYFGLVLSRGNTGCISFMERARLLLMVLCLSSLVPVVPGQILISQCAMLQESQLGNTTALSTEGLLAEALVISGGDADLPSVQILDHNFVCLAQGRVRDTFRSVSVVVKYKKSDDVELEVQIDFRCTEEEWVVNTNAVGVTHNPEANLTTPLRTDCFFCSSDPLHFDFSPTEHCLSKDGQAIEFCVPLFELCIYERREEGGRDTLDTE